MKCTIYAMVLCSLLTTPALAAHRWSCNDVPYWIRSYSPSLVASTATNLGMARWEVVRLLRCLPRQ